MSEIQTINIKGFSSMTNAIMSNTGVVPEIGMGATILMHTDRNPATIVNVVKTKAGKIAYITIQEDAANRIDKNGMSESQTYSYTSNQNAPLRHFSLRKNGLWVESGSGTMWNGTKLSIGEREKYHDFNF